MLSETVVNFADVGVERGTHFHKLSRRPILK
jgi:hypothetical protein